MRRRCRSRSSWTTRQRTRWIDLAYEAPPERLVLVDSDLRVVFASGQGPMQYEQNGMLQVVESYANTTTAAGSVAARL